MFEQGGSPCADWTIFQPKHTVMSRIITSWSRFLCHPSHPCVFLTLLCVAVAFDSAKAFHIECPPDVTVNCDDELWDLSIYGTAYIYGYGDPVPAGDPEWVTYNLNDCGTGTIVRKWVAYDYSGTPYYCSQTIYVQGIGSVDISWPPNYTIHSCSPSTDPEDLPPPYDRPVVNDYGNPCVQIMINYTDQVFDINPPACIKILRKWTVIDWCTYDPNDYYPSGIWQYTQIIKIVPETPPVIHCPPDTTISAGADCTGGHVQLPKATGFSACNAGVTIKNNSPYAYHHGADASGFYPLGTTKVTFTADDGCGGKSHCSMYITVKDMKKPTPVCYYGISISLMQMPDGYYMDLRPEFFNKGSFDNCTPKYHLEFDVEPKRVDCSDVGEVPVKMYVIDQSGNSQYCNTVVYVQDNNDICPPTEGVIAGAVFGAQGDVVSDVEISVMQNDMHQMTDDGGQYSFSHVPFGSSYTIKPQRNDNHLSGITTLDLIVMLKHILGIDAFDEPWDYIAADIDRSGYVSVNDLLGLQQMLVQSIYNQPVNAEWRFVDASFAFSDPADPLSSELPEDYQINEFTGDMAGLDFIGVKLGDLTGDAVSPGLTHVVTRSGDITIEIPDYQVQAGESFTVQFSSAQLIGLSAIQLGLVFDPEMAVLEGVDPGDFLSLSNFGLRESDSGRLSMIWFDVEPIESAAEGLFSLNFQARQALSVASLIKIAESRIPAIAYDATYVPKDIRLHFTKTNSQPGESQAKQEEFTVGQNYPNPFNGECRIPVMLPETSGIDVEVFDANGGLIYATHLQGVKGLQDIAISSSSLEGRGVLFCRISSETASRTLRMLSLTGE